MMLEDHSFKNMEFHGSVWYVCHLSLLQNFISTVLIGSFELYVNLGSNWKNLLVSWKRNV